MDFVERTIEVAWKNVEEGGLPFACLIVKDGQVFVEAANEVVQTHDPTAHAEMVAIRKAASLLQSEHFYGCEFYLLAHPCPMCLAALYYCSPDKVHFIMHREEFINYYIVDNKYIKLQNIYEEITKPWEQRALPMVHVPHPKAIEVYQLWHKMNVAIQPQG